MSGIVGREPELRAAAEFFEGLAGGPAALILEGEAGIGKTTVWAEAVERARGEFCVLFARPAEAEARLAFAALADLLEPVLGGVLADLPAPQRHALAVASLREEPGPRRLDQHCVAAATLSVLRALAARRRVLVAVDDLQWLDGPSARVLEFAVRRLGELPVGVLACQRLGDGHTILELERALPGGRCARVRLGPLSLAALHQVLKGQLGRSLPRRTLVRVLQAAGGNPFFALELARSLPEEAPATAVLELPENLRRLVGDRIAGLPKRAREVLLSVAAAGAPTVELVTSAAPGRRAGSLHALERAAVAGVITVDGSRIRFGHPLFAAGVYWSASAPERRAAHQRLAKVTADVEEQARHLALGSGAVDARLAAAVAAAAEHARRRGAPEVAAELAEHARVLTPPECVVEYQRRGIQVAEYRFHAGELRRARGVLEAVLRQAPAALERADALRLLGEISFHEQGFPKAVSLFEQALEHAGDDAALASLLETQLAFAANAAGNWAAAEPHARRALTLTERLGDEPRLAEALAVSAILDYLLGRGLDEAKLERALELEDQQRQTTVALRPSLIAGHLMLYEGRLQRASQLLTGLRQRILDRGEEGDLPFLLGCLAWAECWRGHLAAAAACADEAVETAARLGMDSMRAQALSFASLPAAYRGDAEAAQAMAHEALALAAKTGFEIAPIWARSALAVLALSQDDPAAADTALGPLCATFGEDGVPEPIRAFFLPDEIEALVALGRVERAERLLGAFTEAARRLERPWALMLTDRCRALLLAARGDLEGASEAAGDALARCAGLELRIEVARTFLIAARVERRRRCKRTAADHLRQALELFERAGASLWARQARAELARVGLRPCRSAELTVSERRVAELAAVGLTNREVAAQLFMSPKTVGANLVRVYQKLHIRSRAELGARLAGTGTSSARTSSAQT